MTTTYSLAAIPAETAPVGDGCEFCMGASTQLLKGDVRQAAGKPQLHPGKDEEVAEDGEDTVSGHGEEEDQGVEGFRDLAGIRTRVLQDSASKSEEGRGGEEGNVFEGQQELLQKGLALHQVVRLVRKVHFCIHLPNDEQGAQDGSDKKWVATHPQVEEQEKLEGSFRFELCHRHSGFHLFHLRGVDKDGKHFRDDEH